MDLCLLVRLSLETNLRRYGAHCNTCIYNDVKDTKICNYNHGFRTSKSVKFPPDAFIKIKDKKFNQCKFRTCHTQIASLSYMECNKLLYFSIVYFERGTSSCNGGVLFLLNSKHFHYHYVDTCTDLSYMFINAPVHVFISRRCVPVPCGWGVSGWECQSERLEV